MADPSGSSDAAAAAVPEGSPTTANNRKVVEFLDNQLPQYDDEPLWYAFHEEFEQWLLEDFEAVSRANLARLRIELRSRGVWVETNSRKAKLAQSLYNLLIEEEEDRRLFDDEDIHKLLIDGRPINSPALNYKIRQRGQPQPQPVDLYRSSQSTSTPQLTTLPSRTSIPQDTDNKTFYGQSEPPHPPRQEFAHPPQQEFPQPPQPQQAFVRRTESSTPSAPGFGRELANLTKMYGDTQKYGCEGDNFSLKRIIFLDLAERADIPEIALPKAFSVILKGLGRSVLANWNAQTLQEYKTRNPDKTTTECFQLLINKLIRLRNGWTVRILRLATKDRRRRGRRRRRGHNRRHCSEAL